MPSEPSASRLEAFSDGVIAVIITIMVLEFKVPKENGFEGLRAMAPTLAVYVLSFVYTGIYWVNHHHLIDRVKRVDTHILWANLIFLFCLSLLPFFTAYMVEKHVNSFSVAVYNASLCVTGSSFTLLQRSVMRLLRHAAQPNPEEIAQHAAELRKGLISLVMYLTAIGLTYAGPTIGPVLGLADAGVVSLMWILPTLGLQRAQHPAT